MEVIGRMVQSHLSMEINILESLIKISSSMVEENSTFLIGTNISDSFKIICGMEKVS